MITWQINIIEREDWISATVEDFNDGTIVGESTAPIVENAAFDTRKAVIRAAVEDALAK